MSWLTPTPEGCVITVKVTPRASRTEVCGAEADWLRVRVQAPPVEGKANAVLERFLADALAVSKQSVCVIAGDTSRLKRVLVRGLPAEAVQAKLSL